MSIKDNIKKVRDNVYEVPGSVNKKMRASGRLYLDDESFEALEDGAIDQIVNIACLPGVHRYAIGLPDIHFGYGFPIGGVAAFNEKNGIVSPGGVGFDINCGVRLIKTNLKQADIEDKLDELIEALFKNIPSGVGSKGKIKLKENEIDDVLNFVFNLKKCDNYNELPETTRLQKSIKEFLINNGTIYEGYGELKK